MLWLGQIAWPGRPRSVFQKFVTDMRMVGEFVPTHAFMRISVIRKPIMSLADILCSPPFFGGTLSDAGANTCVCHLADPGWPRVDLGMGPHICALQSEAPLQQSDAWLGTLPATTRVIPDSRAVYRTLFACLSQLARRMRSNVDATWLIARHCKTSGRAGLF